MSTVRITKEFHFEGAHALTGYDGKCRHIHGHSYKFYVTVKGEPVNDPCNPKNGMVLDFSLLKQIVNEQIVNLYDHALILSKDAALSLEIEAAYQNVILVDFQPTCENLVLHFVELIRCKLPENVSLQSIKMYETPSSYVEWMTDDN